MLLVGSALSLAIGGCLLYVNSLVPIVLAETTVIAVITLIILSYFVAKGNLILITVSTILGVVAPIMSALIPAHTGVVEQIGTGGLLTILGLLQLFGFYIFPLTFVIIRIAFRSRFNGWR